MFSNLIFNRVSLQWLVTTPPDQLLVFQTRRRRARQDAEIETESTATVVDCGATAEEAGVNTNGIRCVGVLTTFVASVNTGFNVWNAAAKNEQSIQTGEFAGTLAKE
jgi:hypothetical protein